MSDYDDSGFEGWGGLLPDTSGQGLGPLEAEALVKMSYNKALGDLMRSIRRTDVELKHLTKDQTLQEMETGLLRMLTLVRTLTMSAMALNAVLTAGTGGLAMGVNVAVLGMAAVTGAAVMMELS